MTTTTNNDNDHVERVMKLANEWTNEQWQRRRTKPSNIADNDDNDNANDALHS